MKGKLIILLLVTLLLLVGVANAADTNTDGINSDISDSISTDAPVVNEVAVQEKQSVSIEDTNTVEKINKKQETGPTSQITTTKNIQKNMNNLKKDTTVSSWEALESEINSATEDTTITLNKETYTVGDRIIFNKPITITIDGNGSTIDGRQTQLFYIYSGSSVILKNITIKNAENNNGYGGAIDNGGNLTIINSTLKNNTANYGGAINNNNGNITIIDSNITKNTATGEYGRGGAIYNNEGGTLTITQSNLNNNTATGQQDGYGGAIYNNGALTITESNLNNNTAVGQGEYGYGLGGAIYNNGALNITQSNLTHNTATGQYGNGYGGAIYNDRGTFNITDSNLTQNNATGQDFGYGGAIYNNGGNLNITQSNLTHNTATGQYGRGGAIYNTGTLNITQSNLTQNNATGQSAGGGAIYNDRGTLNITQSNLAQNNATGQTEAYGGAINNANGDLSINNSILEYNNATNGGSISNNAGTAVIESNYFIANTAQMTGNAIINDGTATIEDNEGDTTTPYHGTIYTNSTKTVIIKHNKFYDKINTNITISINNTKPVVNDKINIRFILNDQYGLRVSNQQLNITIDDIKQNRMTNEDGELNIEYILNHVGTHTVTVSYDGNELYNNCSTSTDINVEYITTKINLTVTNTTALNNTMILITIQLTDDNDNKLNNQNITININGILENLRTDNEGRIIKDYTPRWTGTHTITATYDGNSQYNQSTNSTTINVKTLNTKLDITLNDTTPKINTPITINTVLTDENENKLSNRDVTVNINGKTETLRTDNNGLITTEYTPNRMGTHTITVTYEGNSQYNQSTNSTTIVISKQDTTITIKNTPNAIVNKTVTIYGQLLDKTGKLLANQEVIIDMGEESITTTTDEYGNYQVNITPKNNNTIQVTATYNDNENYTGNTASKSITVNKKDTKITYNIINNTQTNTQINITVTNTIDNTPITDANIIITGDITKTTTSGIITETTLTPGDYIIQVEFAETNEYKSSTTIINFKVEIDKDAKIRELEENITQLNNTVNEQNNTIQTLNNTNKQLQSNITQLNNTNKQLQDTIKTLNNTIKQQNNTIKTLNNTNKQLQANITQLNNTIKTLNDTIKQQNNTIQTLTKENQNLNNTNKQLQDSIKTLNNTIKQQNNTIKTLNNTNKQLQSNITQLNNTIQTLTKENQNLNNTIKQQNNTIKELQEIIKELNKTTTPTPTTTTVSKINGRVGSTTQLKATIKDNNKKAVTNGRVTFKVNGITLKDEDGNTLYALVNNGSATLNYTIPRSWYKDNTIVEATYAGNDKYQSSRANNTKNNITPGNVKIQIAKLPTHENGDKIQFVITATDEKGQSITGGTIIIKANGVTLKDAKGKALQANVVNGVAVLDYNITLSAREYNLTAVYAYTGYNRIEATGKLNVTKGEAFIRYTPITTKTTTTRITANIVDKNKNNVSGKVTVGIKLDGKMINTTTATNGIINVTIPTNITAGAHIIELIAGETGAYKSDRITSVLIKK